MNDAASLTLASMRKSDRFFPESDDQLSCQLRPTDTTPVLGSKVAWNPPKAAIRHRQLWVESGLTTPDFLFEFEGECPAPVASGLEAYGGEATTICGIARLTR